MKINDLLKLEDFNHLKIDTKVSEFEGFWDFIYFIIEAEKKFNIQLFDLEVILFEEKDCSIKDIEKWINFLKNGKDSNFAKQFISNDIIKLRPDLLTLIRNKKINKLIK
jgi:hypothetical protein